LSWSTEVQSTLIRLHIEVATLRLLKCIAEHLEHKFPKRASVTSSDRLRTLTHCYKTSVMKHDENNITPLNLSIHIGGYGAGLWCICKLGNPLPCYLIHIYPFDVCSRSSDYAAAEYYASDTVCFISVAFSGRITGTTRTSNNILRKPDNGVRFSLNRLHFGRHFRRLV
jgi:hypothetical protein